MKIALDVMGGDNAPQSNIIGAKLFIDSNNDSDVKIIFVGPKSIIKEEIKKHALDRMQNNFEICDAEDVITMDEIKPAYAFKNKPNSSLVKSIQLVKENKADAIISAGNTAALLSSSLFLLGKIGGIKRPALATCIPRGKRGFILCDVGANMDVKPAHLIQFAIMSSDYVKYIQGVNSPKVALLNIGSEKNKGNKLTTETYPLMEENIENFIGNIETRDLFSDKADVVVCDGFVGNNVLKTIEGIINYFYQTLELNVNIKNTDETKNTITNIFNKYNYEEHGGSPFLGVRGIVLKCHGSCSEKSIKNTLDTARIFYDNKIINKMEEDLNDKNDLFNSLELTNK